MVKSTLYSTTKVLSGNKLEIQVPSLAVGQTVEVIILVSEVIPSTEFAEQSPSLEERRNFLKLPIAERKKILKSQAVNLVEHYQKDNEWKELMAGDIIDY